MSRVEKKFKNSNTRARRGYCSLLIILLAAHPTAHAQWKPLLPLNGNYFFLTTVYFLDIPGNPRIGFVSNPEGSDNLLMKTTDGGTTWYPVEISPAPSNLFPDGVFPAHDIFFQDSLNGYMAAGDCGIYKTTDAGESWVSFGGLMGLGGNGIISVYYDSVSRGLFVSGCNSLGAFLYSFDGGITWIIGQSSGAGWCGKGFSFSSDSLGIECNGYQNWLKTTDAGNTWRELPIKDFNALQPLAMPGTNTFFAIQTWDATIYRTDDAGNNWVPISSIPFDTLSSGCIRGDSCNLVIQLSKGAYLSTDQGNTWVWLDGPPPGGEYIGTGDRFYYKAGNVYMSRMYGSEAQPQAMLWKLDNISSMLAVGISERLDDGTQQTTLHPGDSVGVTFVPGAGTLAVTDSVELTLRYDPNALSAPTLTLPAGWWVADSSTTCTTPQPPPLSEEGECILRLMLRTDSAEPLPSPLLQAKFKTYLTGRAGSTDLRDGLRTFIYLDSAQSFFPQTTPCAPTTLSLQTPGSVEIDFTGCGDSTLVAAMQHTPPFSIESIVPNPAAATLRVEGSGQGVEAELFDELGRTVIPSTPYPLPFTLDVSGLPSGIYFLRLSAGGYEQTRQISIEK